MAVLSIASSLLYPEGARRLTSTEQVRLRGELARVGRLPVEQIAFLVDAVLGWRKGVRQAMLTVPQAAQT